MSVENLTVVGTSHIAIESVRRVTKIINEQKPSIVAVELDRDRLASLFAKKSGAKQRIDFSLVRKVGMRGFLFMVIAGWFQKQLGKVVKLEPGSDMLAAVEAAHKNKLKLALIDQNITITLRKLSNKLTWRERWNFFSDLVKGIVMPKRTMKQYGLETIDLRKVPTEDVIAKMMHQFKDRYPTVFDILVTQRNSFMAKRLYKLLMQHPDQPIVAVVGAGHQEEIERIVKKLYDANGGMVFGQQYTIKVNKPPKHPTREK